MLGKALTAYTKAPRREERRQRLRGERDKIKFIDLRSERGQKIRKMKKKAIRSIHCMFLGRMTICGITFVD